MSSAWKACNWKVGKKSNQQKDKAREIYTSKPLKSKGGEEARILQTETQTALFKKKKQILATNQVS